jgi:hypothetical protein
VVNQVVDDRDKNKTRRDDLLQVILDLRDKHGRKEFTENVVVGHSMTFLVWRNDFQLVTELTFNF